MSRPCKRCGHAYHMGWCHWTGPSLIPFMERYCDCQDYRPVPSLADRMEAARKACGCARCIGTGGHGRTCALAVAG